MATATTNTLSNYDGGEPSDMNAATSHYVDESLTNSANASSNYDQGESSDSNQIRTTTDSLARLNPLPRPGQHLDDADLLAWKHQYINMGLREQNVLSNSADDLTQLVDNIPYPIERFAQDYTDGDEEELHFDDGNTFDYETSIRDRLKKANEELDHDETPIELKHRQRVSFDAVVRAVDFGQNGQELDNSNPSDQSANLPIVEETESARTNSSQQEANPHEYTVPLNDTQPREGPSMLDKIKAVQFHGASPSGEHWSSHPATVSEDLTSTNSSKRNQMDNTNEQESKQTKSSSPSNRMVVSINGQFQLQDEDDYTAKKGLTTDEPKSTFVPTPPTNPKPKQDSLKPQRPTPSLARPTSSDSSRQSRSFTSKSFPEKKNNQSRPKSAGIPDTIVSFFPKHTSGVDFKELNRKAAAEKREREEEERRKQEKETEERRIQLEKARESFEKWVKDKDAERRRLDEEKRLEKEEHDTRQAQYDKELGELREKKYHEWISRKNRDTMIANEFKKLQADDEDQASGVGGSSASHQTSQELANKRAFQRWLRRKYEQSKEEQRQLRLEARRLRRRQRRSIKRYQLQQDLQLARSFGYT